MTARATLWPSTTASSRASENRFRVGIWGMATIRDKMGHCLHEFFTIVLLRAPAPHQSLIRGVGNDSSGLGSPWQMNAPQ